MPRLTPQSSTLVLSGLDSSGATPYRCMTWHRPVIEPRRPASMPLVLLSHHPTALQDHRPKGSVRRRRKTYYREKRKCSQPDWSLERTSIIWHTSTYHSVILHVSGSQPALEVPLEVLLKTEKMFVILFCVLCVILCRVDSLISIQKPPSRE
jgi:hypothetical protein